MEQLTWLFESMTIKKHSKKILKTLLFVALLITFYFFYLDSQVREFMKHSTTFTSRYEEIENIQVPNILLCMKPGIKKTVVKRFQYKLDEAFIFYDESDSYQKHNLTMWEAYQELTYKYKSDFEIRPGFDGLHPGLETILIKSVKSIATIHNGMCFLLITDKAIKASSNYAFNLTFSNSLAKEDLPSKINLFLVSKETWYGLITAEWPYKENLYIENIDVDNDPQTLTQIGIAEKEVQFLQPNDQDYEDCILKLFGKSSCFPIIFNFPKLTKKLPPCKYWNDTSGIMDKIFRRKRTAFFKCLLPNHAKIYETSVYRTKIHGEVNNKSLGFFFYGASNMKKMKEEVYVISTTAFIGSIGGSLGLFFGFSFLACCSDLIDKLVLRLCPLTDQFHI